MGWDGMGWDGMGWDGMGWDGMGWDGMVTVASGEHPPSPKPLLDAVPVCPQPFCDGSHKKEAPGLSSLLFTPTQTGPALLCGCKRTRSPPYCDGSHREDAVLPPRS
uniref:CDGSH iron sulfur domain 3 n=1 Tax=Zonotrichia albicollis TaxID=44394 RepID=A0A8D2MAR9_ZONAL